MAVLAYAADHLFQSIVHKHPFKSVVENGGTGRFVGSRRSSNAPDFIQIDLLDILVQGVPPITKAFIAIPSQTPETRDTVFDQSL